MVIGDRIHNLRIAKNMTMEELGAKVGVGKGTIKKYESGLIKTIPSDKVELLADALETTPWYLMGWTDIDDQRRGAVHGTRISVPSHVRLDTDPATPTEAVQVSLQVPEPQRRAGAVFRIPRGSKAASAIATVREAVSRSNTAEKALLAAKPQITVEVDPLFARIHGLSTEERQRVSDFVAGIEAKK